MLTKPNQMKLIQHIFTFLGITLVSLSTTAQDWCATHTLAEQAISNNPALQEQLEAVWDSPTLSSLQSKSGKNRNATYIIPVVFHVVHDNGIGDIPYEQLESAIEVLNEDFRRTNADTIATRNVFKPFAVDSDIEFRIARIDPNGNCTNGVVRINDASSSYDARNNVKSVSYWPSNKYLNIWVVNSIRSFGGGSGIVLGYAQFPGFGSWSTYGIVCRNDRLGKPGIGTSVTDGRTLTHEVGHCLNLLHTFQDGCGASCNNTGDRVCDTPPSSEATYGCSLGQNTCANDGSGSSSVFGGDVVDQIENYMSYDDCQNMFSAGQRNRMHAVLNSVPQLSNLVSTANLQATGVLNVQDVLCKADFEVEDRVVCIGQPITFENQSYFNPTSFKWKFEGAHPSTSTEENPEITYSQSGTYEVELTIYNGSDSLTSKKTNYITVLPYGKQIAPVQEGFEFTNQPLNNAGWYADNTDDGNYGWELSNQSYEGSHSLVMKQLNVDGRSAAIESSTYHTSGLEDLSVSFELAYAQRAASDYDVLRVFASTNCGETWQIVYATGGVIMTNRPPISTPYINPSQSDWKSIEFSLDPEFSSEQLRLRFEVDSDNGNYLYLDNLNISGAPTSKPALLVPFNNTIQTSTSVLLDWKAASIADRYELWIDTDPTFNSVNRQVEFTDYISTDNNEVDTEWQIDNLEIGETYYWRVRTLTNGTGSDWSDTWSFTVQDDNSSDVTGIEEETTFKWTVFPNPANDMVRIVPNFDGDASITITNIQGQIVYQNYTSVNANSAVQIETSRFTAGLYILSLESADSGTAQEKVLIQH